MKLMKQFLGAFFVTIAALALFVACSTTGDDCALDSDCSADQVCEASLCVATCVSTADCGAGESCEARTGGSGNVCKAEGTNTNNANNLNNENNVNNVNNVGNTYNFFMVEDTSIGDEACEIADPGSDLQFVRITDGASTVGYGALRTPEFGTEGPGNDFPDTGILDGNAPAFSGDCTDSFADTSVVAMGCGGSFIFQPVGTDGLTPLVLEAGVHTIEVGEYGIECNGSGVDTYNVYGCSLASDGGSVADCVSGTLFLGEASGIGIADVI